MYEMLYEKRALKDLDKIPSTDIEKILILLRKLPRNPVPPGCKKLSGKGGLYRLRQGNYRIVYIINHKEKNIHILLIKHRKDAYR